jgi:hypothetical protein
MLVTNQQRKLEAQATKLLAKAGYKSDGLPVKSRRESLRAILIPCGGKSGYQRT